VNSDAVPEQMIAPEVVCVPQQHQDSVGATNVTTTKMPRPSEPNGNKKRKSADVNSDAEPSNKARYVILPQETRGTPVGDCAQESHGNELQVEEKVAISALENLRLYASDSQSSNDLIGCEVSAHPTTAESRTLALPGRGCLKQTEDWSSVHAIRKVTSYCPAIDMSDARTIHAKLTDAPLEGSVASAVHPEEASLTKKSVSWAADAVVNLNQQCIPPVHPIKDLHTAQENETTTLPLITPILQKGSPTTIARRPVTRSMSPLKAASSTNTDVIPVTRSKSCLNPMFISRENANVEEGRYSPHTGNNNNDTTTPGSHGNFEVATSIQGKKTFGLLDDTTTKKLDLHITAYKDRQSLWLPGEAGSFDLGFDSPNKENDKGKEEVVIGLPVITSSNEDEFYGPAEDYEMLAAMVGEKYFPTSSCTLNVTSVEDTAKQKVTSEHVTSEGTSSKTPIPQAHKKRVIKPAKTQLSPYA
jgi:hypothetical protein